MKQRLPVLTRPRGIRGLAAAESTADSSTEAQRRCTASSAGPRRGLGGTALGGPAPASLGISPAALAAGSCAT